MRHTFSLTMSMLLWNATFLTSVLLRDLLTNSFDVATLGKEKVAEEHSIAFDSSIYR